MPNNYTPIEAQQLFVRVAPAQRDQIAEALRQHKMLRHIDLTTIARELGMDDARMQLAAITYYDEKDVVKQYFDKCKQALEDATNMMVLRFPNRTRNGTYSASFSATDRPRGFTSRGRLEHNIAQVSVTVTQDDTRFGKPLPLFNLGYASDRYAGTLEGAVLRLVPLYHSRMIRDERIRASYV